MTQRTEKKLFVEIVFIDEFHFTSVTGLNMRFHCTNFCLRFFVFGKEELAIPLTYNEIFHRFVI